jgi:hypothetical protein
MVLFLGIVILIRITNPLHRGMAIPKGMDKVFLKKNKKQNLSNLKYIYLVGGWPPIASTRGGRATPRGPYCGLLGLVRPPPMSLGVAMTTFEV